MKCPSCGKTINGDSVFCSYSGMPIRDDYKTRQQIVRNKKEEHKCRSQEVVDAMWSEVESHSIKQKPAHHKMNYGLVISRKNTVFQLEAAQLKECLICVYQMSYPI